MDWFKIITLIVQYGPKLVSAIKDFDPNPIKWIQKTLNDVLSPSPNLVVDGHLGPLTQAAVKAFQQQEGLTVDGIPGLITQLVLASLAKL